MSPLKVTVFLAVGLCLFASYISAEDAKPSGDDEENVIKIYKRLIPADVLRGLFIFLLLFVIIDFLDFQRIAVSISIFKQKSTSEYENIL